jgi:DNA-directed RNA polymerase sigma subunit (sigma70/sigma32)
MEHGPHSCIYHPRNLYAFPMPSLETEQELCARWHDHHGISAAYQLMGSHQRLVVKATKAYRGNCLPQKEPIGTGHVRLMQAACRLDPSRCRRFANYAVCWVRAAVLEYVMHSWSVVKLHTTDRPEAAVSICYACVAILTCLTAP